MGVFSDALIRPAFNAMRRSGAGSPGQYSRGLLSSYTHPVAKVHVDEQIALTYSAVWRAVNYISSLTACVSWHAFERGANGAGGFVTFDALLDQRLEYLVGAIRRFL